MSKHADILAERQAAALTIAREFAIPRDVFLRCTKRKQWVIDQMVRALAGDQYGAWVSNYNNTNPDDPWDEGLP